MANEKRLIDRNEIFPNGTFFANAKDPLKTLDELIARFWSIPTVDAVEVRCMDCEHYQQYHNGDTEELCEWGKCKLISMDVDMPCNGFCCFGERRNNEPEKPV